MFAMLIGTVMLAAGCGGSASDRGDTGLGPTTTASGPSAARAVSETSVFGQALAFAQCMRTRGEPNFPDPARKGGRVQETITAGSGVDPNSPQFTAARKACRHLLPNNGVAVPSQEQTFTSAVQADYLDAAACMRSHGVPDFPDPTFRGDSVTFTSQTPIDTNTPQYQRAATTCQRLIPAGLPYSSSSG
jgi:hypothetical protein